MEALANVNQFGVCGLREDELMEVNGGVGPVMHLVKLIRMLQIPSKLYLGG